MRELDPYDPDDPDALDVSSLDASWLAGVSEYSATGGFSQPLHNPQLRRGELRGWSESGIGELADTDSVEDMYRCWLARATQDDHSSFDEDERGDDGPLHLERPTR